MSGNKRMVEFRGRNIKEQAANAQQNRSNEIQAIVRMLFDLKGQVIRLEDQVKTNFFTAKAADWRSAAIMKLLHKAGISETEIVNKAEEMEVTDFNRKSDEDDKLRKLEPVNGPAEEGMFAIMNVKVFKNNKELEDQQIVRSKIHVGSVELFPELDEAIKGMSVGESKKFPLNLMGETDEGQITLLGLRQAAPKTEGSVDEQAKQ